MDITDKTIEYVSALAKLSLQPEEKEKAKKDIGNILGYIDKMKELNTDGIESMSHVRSMKNVFREDVVTNEENREELLKNAPKQMDGCFMVPKTVD
ncbi:MAG TPA: Asp-tRNA(Asn)/Glu-tRNA(Gln) amidotransferase GatCAB subunit C [Lachnoclostridium phytofermentans]|uniref:Aspartyl/glutamyl-tRNA(Asn/Gln) amidotransferase subunit C n=1 Tax=Lachnoclostridium phytofermentans TaxID=66219 RepID=A0A3D2XC59_9FIRM|nr:Asp-tRNA(Asn)/Glu-tRNA(Gln) amidotransferase subunit GatC [Lachnoclostridium sp.]HCL03918.1 Asp-tRNA(Asn)/Glu-tRNA(Gln) amidotransferase GatCAB subunit C [Lachnoclostridium phytofermentans]